MNLHIVTDSNIAETFRSNLERLGLSHRNKIVVRTNEKQLKNIKTDIPFGAVYSKTFQHAVDDTFQYDHVFIHQFSPLMYRWVATHRFKALNWLVWGADVYNLPGIEDEFYAPTTLRQYVKKAWSLSEKLYKLKILLLNSVFRRSAYNKIDRILTWMENEYRFCKERLPVNKAAFEFFFYVNAQPYHKLDALMTAEKSSREKPRLIVGNSGTPTNNHIDTIMLLEKKQIKADLILPVSYGDKKYIGFLKKNLPHYSGGTISFEENYMSFETYVKFLLDADALLMNTLRPQGYGNILMMLYLGKAVYMNDNNISVPDLKQKGIAVRDLASIQNDTLSSEVPDNKSAILNLFSDDRLQDVYRNIF